jgi:hypothetical protein
LEWECFDLSDNVCAGFDASSLQKSIQVSTNSCEEAKMCSIDLVIAGFSEADVYLGEYTLIACSIDTPDLAIGMSSSHNFAQIS